jgi:hypothetical protein
MIGLLWKVTIVCTKRELISQFASEKTVKPEKAVGDHRDQ